MSIETNIRLTSYASLAAVASTGFMAEAKADLMIFNVGTTFTLEPVLDLGGDPFSTSIFDGTLQLTDLGQTMNFFGIRFAGTNPTNPNDFKRGTGWSANFDTGTGAIAKDKATKMARNFAPGQSVGSKSKFQENLPGGFSKSKVDGSSSFSAAKGVMDGQAYIGFVVPADGFGAELSTFGWVDLTIGENEAGKLTLTINRWAYESVAGTAASIPGGTPVPGAGGLLALALGAAGVRRRRERVA